MMDLFETDSAAMITPPTEEILFKVKCPALGLNVVLFRQTWEEQILPPHPQLRGKEELVKASIQNCHSRDNIFQKVDRPRKIALQKRCPDFEPMNRYSRVAIELKRKEDWAVVTSAYPVNGFPKRGVKKYEPGE
jgi:hypothetical protein